MSDRSYSIPGGDSFETRRLPGNELEVKKLGEKSGQSVAIHSTSFPIDSSTRRIHVTDGENRKLFWVYSRGGKRVLSWPGGSMEFDASNLTEGAGSAGGSLKPLKLTMPGKVLSVKVKEGDIVEPGQGLVIVEAMKMENLLLNEKKAKIAKVHVKEGDRLESGALLITFGSLE